jgi:hypothetical protein
MIIFSILSTLLLAFMIVYSLCRVTSRTCRGECLKSLVFSNAAEARRFEDLLSDGDAESIHRILKALQQRNEIDIIESEQEIYVSGLRSDSADHCINIFRDLIASAHDPMEDLPHLSVRSRFHAGILGVDGDKGVTARGFIPVPVNNRENVTDDLFASEYDISELLGNLRRNSA